MIRELIEYVMTSASREARTNGSLYESIALQARARRQWSAWLGHLKNCHRHAELFLLKTRARRIAFLGSGPLYDVWPGVFESDFEKILLVDVVHPRAVRRRFADPSRGSRGMVVELLDLDLTRPTAIEGLKGQIDAVVSCNLMSQLGLRFRDVKMTERLAREHFKALSNLRLPYLIWSDVERTERDVAGRILASATTVGGFEPDLRPEDEWLWSLAPFGEISREFAVELRVRAWSWYP